MAVQTDIGFPDLHAAEGYREQDWTTGSVSQYSFMKNRTKDDTSCEFYTGSTHCFFSFLKRCVLLYISNTHFKLNLKMIDSK